MKAVALCPELTPTIVARSYLTLSRAVSQLRRCEPVLGGGGLLSCVCVGLFNERWVTAEFHSLSLNA